ncbi:MAG: alcohol dehydrogenase [Puniceicoccaceae bacterium]|nr:MAG: alcohol dehydrogenase [Puniceicoccaceae bacterium]
MSQTNRRLVCPARQEVGWQEVKVTEPGRGEVQVRCAFGAEKHGTMQAFYQGYANERGRWDGEHRLHRRGEGMLWNYPVPLGNMSVGPVTKAGPEVKGLREGDRVAFFHAFQPLVNIPEKACFVLGPDTPWQSAVCLDPAEFAYGAIRDGNLRLGDRLAVSGLGAIGLLTVRLARLAGASRIIALDPLPARRALALRLGADIEIDPTANDGDAGLAVREATGMEGVDVHIDFSGSAHAIQAALRGIAYGGTIVCGAFPPPFKTGFDFGGEAHMNRPHLVFSRACSEPLPDHPRWTERRILSQVLELINQGLIDGREIVDPVVPFDSLPEAYPRIATDPAHTIKLGVRYS